MQKLETNFRFIFRNPSELITSYMNGLVIKVSAEGSSGIDVALTGAVPEKDRIFLNEYGKAFLQYDLEVENRISESTLEFLNQELANIEDSLFKVENLLEEFRVAKKTVNLGVEGQTIFNRLSDVQLEESEEIGRKRYFEYLLDFFDTKKRDGETESTMLPPPVIGIADASVVNLINELNSLYATRQQMSSSLKNRNPQIQPLRRRSLLWSNLKPMFGRPSSRRV